MVRKKINTDRESTTTEADLKAIPPVVPILPTRDMVPFPGVIMSLVVARPASLAALDSLDDDNRFLMIVSQRDENDEEITQEDLYEIGVVAKLVKRLQFSDGGIKVFVQGVARAEIESVTKRDDGAIEAKVSVIDPRQDGEPTVEEEGLINRIRENMQILVEYGQLPEEVLLAAEGLVDPGIFADVIIAHYKLPVAKAQELLEAKEGIKRLKFTDQIVTDDLNHFLVSERIREKTQDELSKGQQEHYLREQLRQIRHELGEDESSTDDLEALREALAKAKLPAHAEEESSRQLRRLERMHPESAEFSLLRTYLEWVAELPWSVKTKDRIDLRLARKILDGDHYGLEKAKERILEFLSVRKLKKDSRGPILCFVGPPGVGKTSLGRSIAQALNRKFYRVSLGGVRDEAEVLGHRRTYVGALPGRIIKGLRQAESSNPVFLLDELDKLGADFRGDPSSALLEVLDPEQNKDFRDHYLDITFDLSSVLFIATANTTDTIPEALLDRLEVIQIAGYTQREKEEIATRYLIPRQKRETGLEKVSVKVDPTAIRYLIERYTQEAGLRNLDREIASLFRKVARKYAESKEIVKNITPEVVTTLLGPTKHDPEESEERALVGLARGLAWTIYGGEMLPVEASVAPGKGNLTLTGQLGSVMQESAQAAMFYARANAVKLGLPERFHERYDIHIHCPGGATPKDGPSAGVTILCALVSALSGRIVTKDIAMTGEITLRGSVLQVGGVKEKALAALRQGIKKIILPYANTKDLEEIPKEQRNKLRFIPVKHVSEVLEIALERKPEIKASRHKEGRGKKLITPPIQK